MIILDTHALVWWVNSSESLSVNARQAIDDTLESDSEVLISSISAWEIAMLISNGHLVLSMDVASWLDEMSQIDGVSFCRLIMKLASNQHYYLANFIKTLRIG